MYRRKILTLYWSLAGWPVAAFIALVVYTMIRPPGNIPEPAATVVQWLWRAILVLSIISVATIPIAWRRISGGTFNVWVGVIALVMSTAFQACCEFTLFRPIE